MIEVQINVIRNKGVPTFVSTYIRDVDELHNLAVSVLNVTATDSDGVSIQFRFESYIRRVIKRFRYRY